MREILAKLLRAQEIDLKIDNLVKSKKDYPQKIKELKKEIDDLEQQAAETEKRILENKKSRMMIEEEITAERETLEKKKKRLLETKTNKEYTAIQHEIEAARERVDNLETEDLELMAEFDELEPKMKEVGEQYEAGKKSNTETIEDIQLRFDSIESDIAKLERQRAEQLKGVSGRPLTVYQRLRKGKSGIAVSTVDHKKHSCRGCFKQLPPQKVLEVRRGTKLIFCESCGRILVWDEREGD
ncbi:MAG: hypothetical protein J7M24_06495 [Candidatus Latescibacteria bacterium]|nr:hypothetical protein [Candidatus Latescibacterota bacterium]